MTMKNPITSAGIKPATFRFLAQHLDHCATSIPCPNGWYRKSNELRNANITRDDRCLIAYRCYNISRSLIFSRSLTENVYWHSTRCVLICIFSWKYVSLLILSEMCSRCVRKGVSIIFCPVLTESRIWRQNEVNLHIKIHKHFFQFLSLHTCAREQKWANRHGEGHSWIRAIFRCQRAKNGVL